jgi:hypothetical protein
MRFMLQRERSDEGAILRDGLYLGLLYKGGKVSLSTAVELPLS